MEFIFDFLLYYSINGLISIWLQYSFTQLANRCNFKLNNVEYFLKYFIKLGFNFIR